MDFHQGPGKHPGAPLLGTPLHVAFSKVRAGTVVVTEVAATLSHL